MQKKILYFFLAFIVINGCAKREVVVDDAVIKVEGKSISLSKLVPGEMRIKVTEDFAQKLELSISREGDLTSNVKSVENVINSLNIIKIERTFPYAGKFEKRTREEGLHLWYDVVFDPSVALTKADGDLSKIEGVTIVEYRPKTIRIGDNSAEVIDLSGSDINRSGYTQTSTYPFDDPLLPSQWHYYNDGSGPGGAISGSDINVLPVWKNITTGKSTVIVGIVDGGVDWSHEDLNDNMWRNPDQTGDRIYGYNFVSDGYLVTPDNHGTHVAGTVAAVNNNGKGVSGVAGGDYSKGIKGVLLMSCQIFQGEDSGGGSKAIKWSADHGAVISQNSWGYPEATFTPASDKAAIDYFNKYAGLDENQNQVGPMKGGIVIFAAGNEDRNIGFPSEYEGALAVASISSDYKRAYYSNYGPWVDICSPGGDAKKGAMVISTLPGNQYGKMQGTSMACPHVSGVAALIVSKHGGIGFTREALWNRLIKFVKPVVKEYNPNFELGAGLVNAYASVSGSNGNAPDAVSDYTLSSNSNTITFNVVIPRDSDDDKPSGITTYFSKSPISSTVGAGAKSFEVGSHNVGDVLTCKVQGLEFDTKYYVAVDAYDISGNKSKLSDVKQISTLSNNPPVIKPDDGLTATIKAHQKVYLNFTIEEVDGHEITPSLEPQNSEAVSVIKLSDEKVQVSIVGNKVLPGNYNVKLIVSDPYGMSSNVVINYTILENHPPVVLKDVEDILFGAKGQSEVLDMNQYFSDQDGESLTYTVNTSNNTVANINYSDGKLYITALSYGSVDITIVASDVMGKSVSSACTILVRDENQEIDIYPNPVIDFLNVRPAKEGKANISIFGNSGAVLYKQDIDISPFNPAKIDMTTFKGGAYIVIVAVDGKEIKRNIVKL